MFESRVRYILNSREFGRFIITEDGDDPIGWDQDVRKIERSKKSRSFTTKYSENLEFVKESARYLYRYARKFGGQGNVTLTREEKNPQTDIFEEIYSESLDLKKYEFSDDKFKTKFLSGGFDEVIKSQMSEKYELDREIDIEGNQISKLNYKTVALSGRRIFLESLLQNRDAYQFTSPKSSFTPRINQVYRSDEAVSSQLVSGDTDISFAGGYSFRQDQVFYTGAEKNKSVKITLSIKNATFTFANAGRRYLRFYIVPSVFVEAANTYTQVSPQVRAVFVKGYENPSSTTINIDFTKTVNVDLLKGEGLTLLAFTTVSANGPSFQWTFSTQEKSISLNLEEDNSFPPTNNNGILFHDALKRQIEIITGSNKNFRSNYFKNGIFRDLIIASGKMIRNLPKLDDERKSTGIPESITLSLKDALSSSGYFNLGYGVENLGNRKIFVVEDLKYFFQNVIVFKLDNVSNIKREFAENYSWKSAEFGNEKAGDYEEQQGRFETNSKNDYSFFTTNAESKFDGTSKLRSDLIGIEYARRKNNGLAPTEDTPYDKENFLIHCKPSGSIFKIRKWSDNLEVLPEGVYDPESAGNFLLTPFRSLERHGWLFNTSLNRFPNEYIRYASTTGYSDMQTKLPNEPKRAENGDIKHSELEYPRIDDEIIKFKTKIDFELRKKLGGYFIKDGIRIPNLNGLVEFPNESGNKEYGWINSVEESDLANFELIKATLSNA